MTKKSALSTFASYVAAIVLFIGGNQLLAQDRGVLPDGRAFRTDSEGTVLVDYIAELEVQVETLNSKVNSLEDEISQKERQINSLKVGQKEPTLLERDLGDNGASKGKVLAAGKLGADAPQAASCPKTICPTAAVSTVSCPVKECKPTDTSAITNDLSRCKSQLEVALIEGRKIQTQLKEGLSGKESEKLALSASLDELKADLASKDSKLAELNTKLVKADQEKELLGKESNNLKAQLEIVNARLARSQEQIEQQKAAYSTRESSSRPFDNSRGVTLASPNISTSSKIASATIGAKPQLELASARDRALASVRGNLKTSINQLNGLIQRRDQLFKQHSSSNKAVKLSPQPLTSPSGLTPQQIAREIEKAASMKRLSDLQRDIGYIKQNVEQDIADVERLSK